MARAEPKSRSVSRGRKSTGKSTSKSPARSKKSPAKKSPSKSPGRPRSTSRGRQPAKSQAAKRTPSKPRSASKPRAKSVSKSPARTPAKTPSKVTTVQSANRSSSRQTTSHTSSEPTLNEIRQRVQRIKEASRFAPAPSSSPKKVEKSSNWCPISFCDKLNCSRLNQQQKDTIACIFLVFIIVSLIYFILFTDPVKARQWVEHFPTTVHKFWKKQVVPKIKFW
ncbi:unnamed protein product, partial [Mesorhabditis spiculigera]